MSVIVADQPTPLIFFKVFLELEMKNLLAYVAFDRKSVKHLLSDENQKHVDPQYPLFYKNRDRRSAIDSALDLNQIQSLNLMIKYIAKHQNDSVYAHLFTDNLVELLRKEVKCKGLFESRILAMPIVFFEWPSLSEDTAKCYSPFNGSMFKLRYEYPNVFPKQHKQELEKKKAQDHQA